MSFSPAGRNQEVHRDTTLRSPPLLHGPSLLVPIGGKAGPAQPLGQGVISLFVQHGECQADVQIQGACVGLGTFGQVPLFDEQ